MRQKIYTIAIVGRPNVGKSTLFNRILGRRKAITESASGTTRDRVHAICKHKDKGFELIDTGGFLLARKDKLVGLIEKQIRAAIHQADILIFVCDAKSGITPLDLEISQLVRRTNKRVILAVNKVDNETLKEACLDFYQ